jgi:hypothetical protein
MQKDQDRREDRCEVQGVEEREGFGVGLINKCAWNWVNSAMTPIITEECEQQRRQWKI